LRTGLGGLALGDPVSEQIDPLLLPPDQVFELRHPRAGPAG
jgi:hypothetical protein